MQYVILDLEWNTAYSRKYEKFINEIIEIGAVKLNEKREIISSFSSFVKPQIEKKLRSRVKILTNITNDDISDGEDYLTVIDKFCDWVGEGDTVFLSWGNMDIRVFIDNFKYFKNISYIPFIKYYVDLQDYCMDMMKLPKSQQLGLNNAADALNINLEDFVLPRALTDSEISAKCFQKLFDEEQFNIRIKKCDDEYYERLLFKPFVISDIDDPLVDKSIMNCKCTECGQSAKRLDNWKYVNGSFRTFYFCKKCKCKMRVNIQFKKYYDRVSVKKSVIKVFPKKQEQSDAKKADA